MPAKTEKQAQFMRAIEHGWKPTHGEYRNKELPSKEVAAEFDHTAKGYAEGGEVEDDDFCPTCGRGYEADDPFEYDEPAPTDFSRTMDPEEPDYARAFFNALKLKGPL